MGMISLVKEYSLFGNGRLSRLGFVRNSFISLLMIISVPAILAFVETGVNLEDLESTSTNVTVLSFVVTLLLGAFVQVCSFTQRLHDLNRTSWWQLLSFIPLLNILLFLYLVFAPSKFALPREVMMSPGDTQSPSVK